MCVSQMRIPASGVSLMHCTLIDHRNPSLIADNLDRGAEV